VRDITHLKEIERFKEDFIANATHDLSNPITTMRTHLYLMKVRPERLTKHIEILEEQTRRLENLVDELRTLSQLDRRIIKLNRQLIDLNNLVVDVSRSYQMLAQNKSQSLQSDLTPDILPVYVDSAKFERVIGNLIANAINYTAKGGTITLSTNGNENMTRFTIEDSGQGIDPADLPHIFERFYRTDRARDSASGSGLGLAIVKELVEAHNGTISVESVIDKGTRFMITLPVVPQASIPDLDDV
jgi:signal transduction histidine kinase